MVDYVSAAVPFAFFLLCLLACVVIAELCAVIAQKWPHVKVMQILNHWAKTETPNNRTGANLSRYLSISFGKKPTLGQVLTAIVVSKKAFSDAK